MSTASKRVGRFLADSGHLATVVVVALAYAVTLTGYLADRSAGNVPDFTLATFGAAVVLGLVYLYLTIWGIHWLESHFPRGAKPVYFTAQLLLVTAIQVLLVGSGGIWLVTMPLIATAATDLANPWRWLVWLGAVASMVVPIGIFGGWETALYAGLMILSATVFVIIFVRLTQSAEKAQHEAERLARELAEANHQLAAYAIQAEELATTQERNRLAREIHDNLGHYLTVVNVQIKAAQAVMDKDPARAQAALARAQQLTEEGLAAVRQSVSALRETPLGARSLHEAIASLAAETQSAGIVTTLEVRGAERPLDQRTELTLYRTAQEGLTNVRKHARASRVDLVLDYTDGDRVALSIVDNGVGMDAKDDAPGFGLIGIRERVLQLGGRLQAGDVNPERHPRGFRVAVELPAAAGPDGDVTAPDPALEVAP
jgi:signal transduction histidine kinase